MNKDVKIEVSAPWSESNKSWNLLVEKREDGNAWSGGHWFPKKVCSLDEEHNILTLPEWLLVKKGIDKIVTYVEK